MDTWMTICPSSPLKSNSTCGGEPWRNGRGRVNLNECLLIGELVGSPNLKVAYIFRTNMASTFQLATMIPPRLVNELDNLPDAGNFWKRSPVEKAAFKLAIKLGLM